MANRPALEPGAKQVTVEFYVDVAFPGTAYAALHDAVSTAFELVRAPLCAARVVCAFARGALHSLALARCESLSA